MDWIELIKIRASTTQGGADEALAQLTAGYRSDDLRAVRVFRHVGVSTDLMVMLVWKRRLGNSWGSDLARSLTEEMMRFGLVDHTVWTEDPQAKEKP